MKTFFVVVVLSAAIIGSVLAASTEKCGEHQVFMECKDCARVCGDSENKPCTMECRRGCSCDKGFVYEDSRLQKCVAESKCACGDGEVMGCSNCQPTCDVPVSDCTKECMPGCACAEGFVRKTRDGKCIPKNQC